MSLFLRLCAAAAALAAGVAPAHSRPDTRVMTCGQAVTLIKQHKALVVSTGQFTYERIVSGQASCGPAQQAVAAVAPTMDSESCRMGYTCRDNPGTSQ